MCSGQHESCEPRPVITEYLPRHDAWLSQLIGFYDGSIR
jgi:hypothetical protein